MHRLFSRAAVNGRWKRDSRATDCFPWDTLTTMRTCLPLPTRNIGKGKEREKEEDSGKNARLCERAWGKARRNDESSERRLITDLLEEASWNLTVSRLPDVSSGTSVLITCCTHEKEKCAPVASVKKKSLLLSWPRPPLSPFPSFGSL